MNSIACSVVFALLAVASHTGVNRAQVTSSRFGWPIQCRSHFCVSGDMNALFGSDCIRNRGELTNSANTKRVLSAAYRNGSMPAWVLAICGGLMCARKSKVVCCNSTETVMTLTRLF